MAEIPGSGADRYTVFVNNLVLMCSIGVRRAERERLQRVRISVELTATAEAAYPREELLLAEIRDLLDARLRA